MAIVPHPRQIQTAVVSWLDQRFPFTKAVDEAMYQRVPFIGTQLVLYESVLTTRGPRYDARLTLDLGA